MSRIPTDVQLIGSNVSEVLVATNLGVTAGAESPVVTIDTSEFDSFVIAIKPNSSHDFQVRPVPRNYADNDDLEDWVDVTAITQGTGTSRLLSEVIPVRATKYRLVMKNNDAVDHTYAITLIRIRSTPKGAFS